MAETGLWGLNRRLNVKTVTFALAMALLPTARSAAAETPSAADPVAKAATPVQGVVVTAPRPKVQVLIDRTVYAVSQDLQTTTGTAADVLNQLPAVDVDADGNISLRGDASVTILVDGKPSAQFAGPVRAMSLQQFPAADIDRIEIMTNPPAQYKAEGAAGVINIITKKTRKPGLSGTVDLNVGDKRRFLAGFSVNDNIGKLKLSAGVNFRQDYRDRRITDQRTSVDPVSGATTLSRETFDEHTLRRIPTVKLGADYDINARQSAGVAVSHREQSGNRYFLQNDQSSGDTGPVTSSVDRHSLGHEWSADNSEELHFDQKLWRPDEDLSLALQRTTSHERERYAYTNDLIIPVGSPTRDDLRLSLDLETIEATADYSLPLSGDRSLKLGYDYEGDTNRFDNVGDNIDPVTGLPVNNPNITNHFRFNQQIHAIYGEYQTPIGRWTVQSGIRLEQTNVQTLQITGNTADSYGYFRAYPSLNVEHKLWGPAKLTLSISRRITRPDPEDFNPFVDYQDIYNLRSGNPTLLPRDTWSYELAYNSVYRGQNYGWTAFYQFNRDSETDITKLVGPNVVLVTKDNLPKNKSAGLQLDANGKIVRQLSYSLTANVYYSQIDALALGATTSGGNPLSSFIGVNVKASADWKPTASDALQISFSRSDKRLTPQGYVSAINLMNLGFKHQITPSLSAVITVTDVLNSQRYQRYVATPTLQDSYRRSQAGQIAYVGFVYTFGAPKKGKPTTFDYEQSAAANP